MITDLILVTVGTVVFTVLTALQKENLSQLKKGPVPFISRAAVLSGTFVSVLKLIILISKFEGQITGTSSKESILFTEFAVMFFIRLRPLLFGLIIKLILTPFAKRKDNEEVAESKTAGRAAGGGSVCGGDTVCGGDSAGGGDSVCTVNTVRTVDSLSTSKLSLLSPREKEVARLAAKGYSNAQIADELFISTETVKRHMATIFEKLGIESRFELKEII